MVMHLAKAAKRTAGCRTPVDCRCCHLHMDKAMLPLSVRDLAGTNSMHKVLDAGAAATSSPTHTLPFTTDVIIDAF